MFDIKCVTDRLANGMTAHQITPPPTPHLSTVTFISDAACFMDGKHEQEVQFTRFSRGSAWDAAFSYQSKIDASVERGSHVDYLQIGLMTAQDISRSIFSNTKISQ